MTRRRVANANVFAEDALIQYLIGGIGARQVVKQRITNAVGRPGIGMWRNPTSDVPAPVNGRCWPEMLGRPLTRMS
jgi:hypothetical protein